MKNNKKWWHRSTVYQIYPRSFNDSNGDGIGDIKGIIEKLDYISELGVDIVWLSPIYKSPNDDNGYDISDYYGIMDEFGTMEDFEELIAEAGRRGIRILMDLVVNHTSDEHAWFVEARKSKDNPYRDYYIWSDPVDGHEPNNLTSIFSGSAWQLDDTTGQYYLHIFSRKQPDLNWENERMRKEIYDMMNFWIDKGIGGFRMDVIEMLGKKPFEMITDNGPMEHEYLKEMNRNTFGKHDLLTVGECFGTDPETAKLYSLPERNELSMTFQFEHITMKGDKWHPVPYKLTDLKRVFKKWQLSMRDSWGTLVWCNHDQPRAVSAYGDDGIYRVESAKMLATLLHGMRGTPYIYQGEEIGMTNIRLDSIDEYDDIETKNMYAERIANGESVSAIMESIYTSGRDNARTPMQWNSGKNAGFTDGTPWLKVNDNYRYINAETCLKDRGSIFHHYKKLVELRKQSETIVYGGFNMLYEEDEQIFAYERTGDNEKILVVCNYSSNPAYFEYEMDGIKCTMLLSNYTDSVNRPDQMHLRPYEAVMYKLVI